MEPFKRSKTLEAVATNLILPLRGSSTARRVFKKYFYTVLSDFQYTNIII